MEVTLEDLRRAAKGGKRQEGDLTLLDLNCYVRSNNLKIKPASRSKKDIARAILKSMGETIKPRSPSAPRSPELSPRSPQAYRYGGETFRYAHSPPSSSREYIPSSPAPRFDDYGRIPEY